MSVIRHRSLLGIQTDPTPCGLTGERDRASDPEQPRSSVRPRRTLSQDGHPLDCGAPTDAEPVEVQTIGDPGARSVSAVPEYGVCTCGLGTIHQPLDLLPSRVVDYE